MDVTVIKRRTGVRIEDAIAIVFQLGVEAGMELFMGVLKSVYPNRGWKQGIDGLPEVGHGKGTFGLEAANLT
jgi:hypothetical protein